ncbi:hypothetical protein Vretifemale_2456, partial [Volvox reticuliferus]
WAQPPSTGAGGEGTRSRFISWLLGARRKPKGPEIPSPERTNTSPPSISVAGPSATPASESIPETRPSDVPSPVADTTWQPAAAASSTPVATGTTESPDPSAARDPPSRPPHKDAAVDVRGSPRMQIQPASDPSLLRGVSHLDRLRPTPLDIPIDPRIPALAP